MAKSLSFTLGALSFELNPRKVDRDHLYGHTELRALTDGGSVCVQGSINGDGMNIICPGATKIGITDSEGRWIERSELVPASGEGEQPTWVNSSFEEEIVLEREATVEELLDLTIRAIYQLNGDEASMLASMLGDSIFTFPFSYRGGYESSRAFLLANDNGLFMLTGTVGTYEYLTLDETGELDCPDDEANIEEGELDFSMM